jgi:F-type H+-transporting ATPase subunit epsilon
MAEALADSIELEVVTPERQLVKESVTEAQIPAREGYIGVLPGHAPLLSLLGSGPLTYNPKSGPRKVLAIHGGFVEVLPDHIRVLANLAERAEEIDLEKARAALKQANERLASHDQSGATDPAVALSESELARARVDAAELR